MLALRPSSAFKMDISSLLERAPSTPSSGHPGSAPRISSNGSLSKLDTDSSYHSSTFPSTNQPSLMSMQPDFRSLPTRFQPSPYTQSNFAPQLPPYHPQQSFGLLPPITTQDQRLPPPSTAVNGVTANGPTNKRLAPPGPHPAESPAKKKQSKWSPEEDAAIIELRGNGMKWEDISKHLPGRSAISCRLRFQNYLERRSEWDDEKKNKLARLYERFKKDMWEKIAKEMALPWRAAEAMHWQIGEVEMASRANVPVFHLAGSATQSQAQQPTVPRTQHYYSASSPTSTSTAPAEPRSNSTSPSSAHSHYQPPFTFTSSHTLPYASQPISPRGGNTRRSSVSSLAGVDIRSRADSARDSVIPQARTALEPHRQHLQKRYVSPFADKTSDGETS